MDKFHLFQIQTLKRRCNGLTTSRNESFQIYLSIIASSKAWKKPFRFISHCTIRKTTSDITDLTSRKKSLTLALCSCSDHLDSVKSSRIYIEKDAKSMRDQKYISGKIWMYLMHCM